MTDKLIRASNETWKKLRTVAYERETHIKTVLDKIMSGEINPLEIEMK